MYIIFVLIHRNRLCNYARVVRHRRILRQRLKKSKCGAVPHIIKRTSLQTACKDVLGFSDDLNIVIFRIFQIFFRDFIIHNKGFKHVKVKHMGHGNLVKFGIVRDQITVIAH